MQVVKLALAVTSCLAIRSAAAQPAQTPVAPVAPPSAPAPPAARPQSVLPGVLSTEVGTIIDGRLDRSKLYDDDISFFALNLHGQYIGPSGFGGYLSLPIAFVSGGGDDEAFLGNAELGGLFVLRSGSLDTYARGGLAVGRNSLEDGLGEGLAVPLANLVPHPADAVTTGLYPYWLRVGAGLRMTSGVLVLGGSLGVDVPLGADEVEGVLHLSGSVGFAQPWFGAAVGMTVLQPLENSGERIVGLQGIVDAPIGRRTRIYGALGFLREDDEGGFSIGAGVRAGL